MRKETFFLKSRFRGFFCVFIKLIFPLLSLQKTSSLSYPPATPILLFNPRTPLSRQAAVDRPNSAGDEGSLG